MSLLVTLAASSSVRPLIISVNTDDVPMALAQPNVLNFASAILPLSSSLKVSLRASPQAREPTSPTPSGFSTSPTFRGLKKWSLSFSVYSHMLSYLVYSISYTVYRHSCENRNLQPSDILLLTGFQRLLKVINYIIDVLC